MKAPSPSGRKCAATLVTECEIVSMRQLPDHGFCDGRTSWVYCRPAAPVHRIDETDRALTDPGRRKLGHLMVVRPVYLLGVLEAHLSTNPKSSSQSASVGKRYCNASGNNP